MIHSREFIDVIDWIKYFPLAKVVDLMYMIHLKHSQSSERPIPPWLTIKFVPGKKSPDNTERGQVLFYFRKTKWGTLEHARETAAGAQSTK
jgi:hypothetical protein